MNKSTMKTIPTKQAPSSYQRSWQAQLNLPDVLQVKLRNGLISLK